MNIRNLETIAPFIRIMRKSLRRWWVVSLITILGILLFPLISGSSKGTVTPPAQALVVPANAPNGTGTQTSSPSGSWWIAAPFLVFILVLIFLYFRNIKKNAELKKTIIDFGNITQIDVFVVPYRRLLTLSKIILPLDAISFIFWPLISFPFKFVFWINYRKVKRNFKKLRRKIARGEKKYEIKEIYDDPFYDFLMREGLYQGKDFLDDLSTQESTDTKDETIESEDKEEKDEKK